MKKIFKVSGMKCCHCAANVENSLKALCGVNNAVASLADNTVTVDFDESIVNAEDFKHAVESAGHYDLLGVMGRV